MEKMEEIIEYLSIVNIVCFILFSISMMMDKPFLMHIGFVGFLISLGFSSWVFIKTKKFKNKDMKTLFIGSINSSIFCLTACVLYFYEFFNK